MLAPSTALAFAVDRALQRRIEDRVGRNRARKAAPQWRQWQTGIGPLIGVKGETKNFTVQPRCLFKPEKFMATDTAIPTGHGSRVVGLFVGRKNQMPGAAPILSADVAATKFDFDLCQAAYSMTAQVEFLEDCTFIGALFGQAAH